MDFERHATLLFCAKSVNVQRNGAEEGEGIQMSDGRPIFQWENFMRSIFVLFVDFIIMVVLIASVCGLFYFIFIRCNMQNSQLFTGCDYVEIIRSIVWPIFLLIVLMLFRNPIMRIVYELPGFVRRSQYGQKSFSKEEKSKAFQGASRNEIVVLRRNKEKEIKGIMGVQSKRKIDYENVEKVMLKKIKNEYRLLEIKPNVRILESNVFFDGAFWKDDHLYAIEIKFIRNPNQLQCYLERTAMFVQGLPKKYRENFSLILCLVVESELICLSERAASFIDKYAFEVIIKYYSVSDIENNLA